MRGLKYQRWGYALLQIVLTTCAVWLSSEADSPPFFAFWLGLAGFAAFFPVVFISNPGSPIARRSNVAGWICVAGLLVTTAIAVVRGFPGSAFCDFLYGVVAALLASVTAIAAFCRGEPEDKKRWLALALMWCLLADLPCLAEPWTRNDRAGFAVSLVALALLLMAWKATVRLPYLVVQVVNTVILIAIGLPVLEFVLHPPHRSNIAPAVLKQYYSYRVAKKDRAAFVQWWKYYRDQEARMNGSILVTHNEGHPTRLRTNSVGDFMDAHISINSRGFRGREIPAQKGDTYRIVVLGESTTFGYTINAGDKPWPELLENMIRDRLKLRRPVEVINAGIPSATLIDNLEEFQERILSLQPDMIICYHGVNGFFLLGSGVSSLLGPPAPEYHARPLQILADAEYGFRLKLYLRHLRALRPPARPAGAGVTDNAYARAYRQLIAITHTNGIPLVLANFPLAVNAQSPPEVVEFFRLRHPEVVETIRANEIFGQMMRELVRQNPGLLYVDTHPGLDGDDERFLDLMHLTQEGDRQLAESFFAVLKGTLESEPGASQNQDARPPNSPPEKSIPPADDSPAR